MREHLEAINHAEAINYIKDIAKRDIEINERTIKEIHSLILHGIDRENAGRYRTVPVLVVAYLHDELVRIHPFIDGNGRTSRLLMNLYLLRNGYVIITLKGSNDAKVGYYKALEKSHTEHLTEDFLKLVVEAEVAALQRYLSIMA